MRESPMYQEILEEGKQEGRQEGIELVARNLLGLGMTIEQVAIAAELTIDRVNQLTIFNSINPSSSHES